MLSPLLSVPSLKITAKQLSVHVKNACNYIWINEQYSMAIKKIQRQINQYDKILKENMEIAMPGLIENVLKIHIIRAEELEESLQHTKERKPDVLKKITDNKGKTYALHVEFQTMDDPDMVYRMAEYGIMIARKSELEVKQYVIHIGANKVTRKFSLSIGMSTLCYHQIALSNIDYHIFLRSKHPEERMLAILADFGKENPRNVFDKIISKVFENLTSELEIGRRKNQLRVLAQLRTLVFEKLSIMEHVSSFFKIEDDICYREGKMEAEEKKNHAFIKKLLTETDFSITKIASFVDVTEAYVRKVKKEL